MLRDRANVKGQVRATVTELDDAGLAKLEALRLKYPERKKSQEYRHAIADIFKEHGHKKKREKVNFQTFLDAAKATKLKWRDMKEVLTYEVSINHNAVTNQGDAMIADWVATTATRTKVDNANGYIEVGTGWTGTSIKTNTAPNTQTGNGEAMDTGYPTVEGTSFGAADDNIVQYRATFEAGDLNSTGIDEACMGNTSGSSDWDCLAYAQISPAVNVTTSDTLQVDWELTFTGST